MRNSLNLAGSALLVAAALALAGCQGGAATGGGPVATSAPSSAPASASSGTTQRPAPRAAAPSTQVAATDGLKSYKVYSTTESLCQQTCRSESRCVTQTFSPIQTINGYVAGQCQLFGR